MTKEEFNDLRYGCPIYQSVYGEICRLKFICHFDNCPFTYWINATEVLKQKKIEIQEGK